MPETQKPEEIVIVEHMPEYLKASHIAANNWGTYPMNGAHRQQFHRYEAEELSELPLLKSKSFLDRH
jgi:hypothetical protein